MQTINIIGKNKTETTKRRIACRGILCFGNKILLGKFCKFNAYNIPGGGKEKSESLETCVLREVFEETGYTCRSKGCFLRINEYYEDCEYITFYYELIPLKNNKRTSLTKVEEDLDFKTYLVDLIDALNDFSTYEDKEVESIRGLYEREYNALKEYINLKEKNYE